MVLAVCGVRCARCARCAQTPEAILVQCGFPLTSCHVDVRPVAYEAGGVGSGEIETKIEEPCVPVCV